MTDLACGKTDTIRQANTHGAGAMVRSVVRSAALIVALLVAGAGQAWAQEPGSGAELTGSATQEEDGAPLATVEVRVETADGAVHRAFTDADGSFRFSDLPAGAVTVTAERVGLEPLEAVVELEAGETARLDFELESRPVTVAGITATATGEARQLSETAAAVSLIDADAIAERRAAHPSELMGSVPGVHVNVAGGGEGHMTAIRQPLTTDPVYLYLEDGVPTRSTGFFNHNALYEVNLPQAGGVEVLKGPATARHGSDAIGGVIDVSTRAPSPAGEWDALIEGGGHGWGRLLLSASDSWSRDGVRGDLNLTRSDGWRDDTGYDRQSGTLRWDRRLGGGTSLRTVASFSRIDQESGGTSPLSRDLFEEAPERNLAPIAYREVRAFRLSTELEAYAGDTRWSVTPFFRSNNMELLPDWALHFDPAIWETGHTSVGLQLHASRTFDTMESRLVAGVDLDYSPGSRHERSIDPEQEDARFTSFAEGDVLYDYDVTFAEVAPYVHGSLEPAPGLTLSAGLRADLLRYDYESHLPALDTGSHRRPADTSVRYTHLSPDIGLTYDLTRATNLFASYRHGFRAPSEGQLFRQGTAQNTVALEPVRTHGVDVGVRGGLGELVTYDLTGYYMPKRDDIVTFTHPDGTPETQNAGETLHRGVEAGLGAELLPGLRLDLAYSYARHTYEAWQPQEDLDYGGNEIEFAPRQIGSAEMTLEPAAFRGGRVSLEWSRMGSYWMDEANSTRYEGHDLLNLRMDVPLPRNFGLFARVTNLSDERYAERASYHSFRGEELAPGQPRTLFVGVEWR